MTDISVEKFLLKIIIVDALLVIVISGTFAIVNEWAAYLDSQGANEPWIAFILKEFCAFLAFCFIAFLAKQMDRMLSIKSKPANTQKKESRA